MKRKYSGLSAFIIFFLTVLLAVSYATWGSERSVGRMHTLRKVKPPVDISVPSPSAIREMEKLQQGMKKLFEPREIGLSPVNLILFGYQPMGKSRITLKGAGTGLTARMDYNLSLAFVSGKRRFCIIDGSFYEQGNHLKDGEKIIKIESNRVLIGNRQIKEWIPLAEREKIQKDEK